jgi:hypothetical protein
MAASSAGACELMAMPAAERARLQPSELRRRALAVGLPDATALDAWPWTCGVHAAALDAGLVARLPARLSPGWSGLLARPPPEEPKELVKHEPNAKERKEPKTFSLSPLGALMSVAAMVEPEPERVLAL